MRRWMIEGLRALIMILATMPAWGDAAATPPPIGAFARLPAIRDVAISPDGKQLLFITGVGDHEAVVTIPVALDAEPKVVLASNPNGYDLSWCGWANDKRILCGVDAEVRSHGGMLFGITRLVGVDADGENLKALFKYSVGMYSQFQDQVLDWTPDEPDTILMQLDPRFSGYSSVYEVNVNTGRSTLRTQDFYPIQEFATDGAGQARFGYGSRRGSDVMEYFARLDNDKAWLPLAKIKAFEGGDTLVPLAIIPGTNRAYAKGNYEGRQALWEMDLSDREAPKLVFSHPYVDAAKPLLTPDQKLLGIYYETDRPFVYYTDEATGAQLAFINRALPNTFNRISAYSRDRQVYVVEASSDVVRSYYLFRAGSQKIQRIDTAYPELDPQSLGRMQSITYPARDGVEIPGYLTVPAGVRAENLPLIVLPHAGPISRDSWEFDYLRAFLVSRGYAVLQMNFRGSSGYGEKWLHDAHQDWGGLSYADVTDGTRWAVQKGIADPKRICMVGWNFGGYMALLSAARNGDLYRCSASLAGISDLTEFVRDSRYFMSRAVVREQVGNDKEQRREDSPLQQVAKITHPIFLFHGGSDVVVNVAHSRQMASALKRAGKEHRVVIINGANDQLRRKSDRLTLLTELERFLTEHLGPGTLAVESE